MKIIVCRIQEDDEFVIDGVDFTVDLFNKEQYKYTFWTDKRKQLDQVDVFTKGAIDLFYISLMVYYADRRISRKKEDDNWTRSIKIYMPVFELEKWISNKKLLEKMLCFLSGDRWFFKFRERDCLNKNEKIVFNVNSRNTEIRWPKAVCMLSGGLDSFVGAIDILCQDKDVWFVSHHSGGKGVSVYQDKVIDKLTNHFKLSLNHFFRFYSSPKKGIEDTTRTRSFMFFAHAILLISSCSKEIILHIPENGFISLNIPFTNTRLGSNSTRTTHPYYMSLLQQLLSSLNLKVKLNNPFQFKTKGEMIENCIDPVFLKENIIETMSCSKPDIGRFKGESESKHCGNCLPCLIRRAAIEFAHNLDKTEYRDKGFKEGEAKNNLRSFKLGIKDYVVNKTEPALSIQTSGPITENIDEYCGIYTRGMNELKTLLDKYNG